MSGGQFFDKDFEFVSRQHSNWTVDGSRSIPGQGNTIISEVNSVIGRLKSVGQLLDKESRLLDKEIQYMADSFESQLLDNHIQLLDKDNSGNFLTDVSQQITGQGNPMIGRLTSVGQWTRKSSNRPPDVS